MFKKILIANRGEIACRVIKSARKMGIATVAIYSDADRNALHVKMADEAVHIGPAPANQSYIVIDKVMDAIRQTGAEAVHPGYGFLSENTAFAHRCAEENLVFIGPSTETLALFGDKVQARALAQSLNIPVIPGTEKALSSVAEALLSGEAIGYPLMLKASAGGGGRGMRVVENADEMSAAFERCQSEAEAAFGNGSVFAEKLIRRPRHIEIQILADHSGNTIHLHERDCSVQLRNQKVIEIAPAPNLDKELKAKLYSDAIKLASSTQYVNAGTVEFLVTPETGQYYFIECNPRIQVEHTITEQITGVDIVREQLRIAADLTLSYRQEDIAYRGYALQFRINAEDPKNDFLPSFGRISHYYAPGGPGVRVDTAIYTGYEIPPYFDSMCLKLVVWALTWEEVVDRGERALDDMRLHGIKTTASYYRQILKHPDFQHPNFNTSFVPNHPELLNYSDKRHPSEIALALATAIAAHADL